MIGEKWGTFALGLEALQLVGTTLEFGGGGWWVSVAGNELFARSNLLRSHVREEAQGLEAELTYAMALWESTDGGNAVEKLLQEAIKRQNDMLGLYDAWAYKDALYAGLEPYPRSTRP